ncbi:MAG TPA: heavy-metal-associated domain-containing protein [Sphingomicrobium sp.]|nr:heavy-metal-associated domain-containing protein [Sphingomicrobium sp.]
MLRRRLVALLTLLFVAAGLSGVIYAQMESGDRGIPPIDSSGTLEITGIKVDVAGPDAQSARLAGWRIAQREGFKALWAKMHNRPASEAPNVPDSVLDGLVASIVVGREQIGPNRYIAELGVLFDRARSAQLLGVGGEVRRSVPMLLVPVIVTAGTDTTVELRNPWQRAWAEFRTSQSPIDYVRVSGTGIDPLLVNASQVDRPGRGWWRNIIDLYGAYDILTAQVQLHRMYPGGPAVARFVGFHGPDRAPIGAFTLRARDSADLPRMMREGVQKMDELFAAALAAGRLERDPSLDIPLPPPPPIEEIIEEAPPPVDSSNRVWTYQVQIVSPDVTIYNFAMAHLRTTAGVESVAPVSIFPGGVSYVNVTYRGDIGNLRSALAARGWAVTQSGYVLRMSSTGSAPPPVAPPAPPPQPQPQPAPPQEAPPGNAQ